MSNTRKSTVPKALTRYGRLPTPEWNSGATGSAVPLALRFCRIFDPSIIMIWF